jgi:cysteinyl-tRNA synthetase
LEFGIRNFTYFCGMEKKLVVNNSLTRQKEVFEPIHEGYVGMYVCGPTVYSDVHLGNCRTFVGFDVIYRYLMYLGYKVRYVRNITDVGHLEGDADTGAEDKISKKARLERLEPMEIVQRYSNGFHEMMSVFNTLPPSIEPRATGHIIEQIDMVKKILENGYAYEANGSVYFDTLKFIKDHADVYGKLSGRKVDELLSETRENLKKQDEKRHPSDFAIWIKADPQHIMRWPSEWSSGFPGWHLECSAMSTKYLGKHFDIHGGGNDLKFPHHENEIAQNYGACGCTPANYWLHGNMLLMNGRKMAKSDGNTITPIELFTGDSPHVSKGYSPMVVRFFMLQSHYGSTLDLTDEALQAAEKGFRRLMEANKTLQGLQHPGNCQIGPLNEELDNMVDRVFEELNDDFNTPKALARLFELVTKVNSIKEGHLDIVSVSPETLKRLQTTFRDVIFNIFGLKDENAVEEEDDLLDGLMQFIIELRAESRQKKDWDTADKIRDTLKALNIILKDGKEGTSWSKG